MHVAVRHVAKMFREAAERREWVVRCPVCGEVLAVREDFGCSEQRAWFRAAKHILSHAGGRRGGQGGPAEA